MKRLLIIDDDPDIREYLEFVGSGLGLSVISTGDAAYFKESVANDNPDAVVIDLEMPGQSGIDLIEWMQQQRVACPVILFSGMGASVRTAAGTIGRIKGLDITSIIEKPADRRTLEDAFSAVLR